MNFQVDDIEILMFDLVAMNDDLNRRCGRLIARRATPIKQKRFHLGRYMSYLGSRRWNR